MIRRLVGEAVLAAVLLAMWPPGRRLAWLALRGAAAGVLALVAELVERRRVRRCPPRPALPAARAWRVRLTTRDGARPRVLVEGDVTGPWLDAAEVEAEALLRFEELGRPGAGRGRVYAKAVPLAPATRPVQRGSRPL